MANRCESGWKTAERLVEETLSELMEDGFLILNDIKYRYGNIDHAVIRPDGVAFLIETKSHRGRVTTDGKHILVGGRLLKRNPISQVMRSIRWIRDLVKRLTGKNPWVVAVLVFPNASIGFRRSIKRVNVLQLQDILPFIRQYPAAN